MGIRMRIVKIVLGIYLFGVGFHCISSFAMMFEHAKYKDELKEHIGRIKCDDTEKVSAKVKSFGNRVIQISKELRKTNWNKKFNSEDIIFYDWNSVPVDTALTLLAKHACSKKNCLGCLQKFYFLLKLPDNGVGEEVLKMQLAHGDTLFSIACTRGLYLILAFLINRKLITNTHLHVHDKVRLEQNRELITHLLSKEVFDLLKSTNFGLESYDMLQQKMFEEQVQGFDTIFANSFDHYVCYVKTIISFLICSGLRFDYKAVINRCRTLLDTIVHLQQGHEKMIGNSTPDFTVEAYGHEFCNSYTDGFDETLYYAQLSRKSCVELRNICEKICQKLEILYYATDRIKKFYDLKVVTVT